MRMSRHLALYGSGGRKALCYFCGALSETLTIAQNGVTVATVTTNANGKTDTEVELKPGTYTISGSVSAYTKTVTIKKDGTYNACPDGAIYWFGNFVKGTSFTGVAIRSAEETYAVNGNNVPTITPSTNNITITSGSGNRFTSTAYLQSVALKAGTIEIVYTSTNFISGRAMVFNSLTSGHANTASAGFSTSTSKKTSTITLDSDTTAYVGVELGNNNSGTKSDITIYSIVNNASGDSASDTDTDSDTGIVTEKSAGINSKNVLTETYRYTTANTANPWLSAGSYSTENYVGHKSGETNSILIPVGSFSFTGTSTKLQLSFTGYCPSTNFGSKGFLWAICSSNANKTMYQGQSAVTGDSYQLATGTGTFAYNSGSYTTYTVDMAADNLPSGQELYVYLWPNGTYTDVAHIKDTVSAQLYYMAN